MIESGVATILAAALILIAAAIVIGCGCAFFDWLGERRREAGRKYIQQQAVDRGYGQWVVNQGENEFQWNHKGT